MHCMRVRGLPVRLERQLALDIARHSERVGTATPVELHKRKSASTPSFHHFSLNSPPCTPAHASPYPACAPRVFGAQYARYARASCPWIFCACLSTAARRPRRARGARRPRAGAPSTPTCRQVFDCILTQFTCGFGSPRAKHHYAEHACTLSSEVLDSVWLCVDELARAYHLPRNPSKSSLELERHIFAVYLLGLKGIGRGAARRLKMMNASTEVRDWRTGVPDDIIRGEIAGIKAAVAKHGECTGCTRQGGRIEMMVRLRRVNGTLLTRPGEQTPVRPSYVYEVGDRRVGRVVARLLALEGVRRTKVPASSTSSHVGVAAQSTSSCRRTGRHLSRRARCTNSG